MVLPKNGSRRSRHDPAGQRRMATPSPDARQTPRTATKNSRPKGVDGLGELYTGYRVFQAVLSRLRCHPLTKSAIVVRGWLDPLPNQDKRPLGGHAKSRHRSLICPFIHRTVSSHPSHRNESCPSQDDPIYVLLISFLLLASLRRSFNEHADPQGYAVVLNCTKEQNWNNKPCLDDLRSRT